MATIVINGVELEVPDSIAESFEKRAKGKKDTAVVAEELKRLVSELRRGTEKQPKELSNFKMSSWIEGELKKREQKWGYRAGLVAHLATPEVYGDVDEEDLADPVGRLFPIDTAKRARASLSVFLAKQHIYPDIESRVTVYERILRALKKFGETKIFQPSNPLDWLVSKELKEWMEGYDAHREEDTPTKRQEMRKSISIRKYGTETTHLVAFASPPLAGGEDKEGAAAEMLHSFFRQLLEVLSETITEFMEELMSRVEEEVEKVFEKPAEKLADAIERLADTVADLVGKAEEGVPPEEIAPEEGEVAEVPTPELPPVSEEEEEGRAAVPAASTPPAPPAAPAAPIGGAALAKAIGAIISDELNKESKEEQEEVLQLPYLRADEAGFEAAKESPLGKMIDQLAGLLMRRFTVEITPEGGLEFKEEEKEEGKEQA